MSTTPRPPQIAAAPNGSGTHPNSSTQSASSVAARTTRLAKRSSGSPRQSGENAHPLQLSLIFDAPLAEALRSPPTQGVPTNTALQRFAHLDQRMTTTDVLRVVGVNRSTIFRWVKRGIFPQRHVCGGWLRSDVEKWLADKMDAPK